VFVEFAFLSKPGQADIQSDLFYDYRTNVEAYPKWQAWMREKQRRRARSLSPGMCRTRRFTFSTPGISR
jgi:hypothetical protein